MGHQNQDLRIKVSFSQFTLAVKDNRSFSTACHASFKIYGKMQFNEGEWEKYPQVTAVCVGNAKYFGGGMKITPNADPFTGNLEVNCCSVRSR